MRWRGDFILTGVSADREEPVRRKRPRSDSVCVLAPEGTLPEHGRGEGTQTTGGRWPGPEEGRRWGKTGSHMGKSVNRHCSLPAYISFCRF